MFNCQGLRLAVFLSAFLLLASLTLEFAARLFSFPAPIMGLALFSGLAAVAVLAITLVIALLPGSAQRLSECRK
jgi:hypothetical protein